MRASFFTVCVTMFILITASACRQPVICTFFPEACHEGFTDLDGDGYLAEFDDCDDNNAAVNPGAVDVPCNGVNENCDDYLANGRGGTYADVDGDGYGDPLVVYEYCDPERPDAENRDDCDDSNPTIGPGADESTVNQVDDDCDGQVDEDVLVLTDEDHDGFSVPEDCDDADGQIHPAATETCDGADNDCDGLTDDEDSAVADQTTWYADADQDGYGTDQAVNACVEPVGHVLIKGDCNDANPDVRPSAEEWDCEDPTDYNCDGATGYDDSDLDGYAACQECDDFDRDSYPGAPETCDGADNDCNGITDDPEAVLDPAAFYLDVDGDSFGNVSHLSYACEAPDGYVVDATDCDDSDPLVHPDGTEVCEPDDVDEDCDGLANDADPSVTEKTIWYRDQDEDGSGGGSTASACRSPVGYTAVPGDCLDTDPRYYPGAPETDCSNPADYNCDGITGFVDGDSDGFPACEECDDSNAGINPAAVEVCDGQDNNCNGITDGASEAIGKSTFYRDEDGDGYGKSSAITTACSAPTGYVSIPGDCDDTKSAVNPAGSETCNGWDDDCDGAVDDADTGVSGRTTYYRDADSDSYGTVSTTKLACLLPSGYVTNAADCNDSVTTISPAAAEICDGKDNDCDGQMDDADSSVTGRPTWYADADADSYGNSGVNKLSCAMPSGYVSVSTDCNDSSAAVYPTATEVCNGVDDNCAGGVDEGVGTTWYRDADGDGYRNANVSVLACSKPNGYLSVDKGIDCDDSNRDAHYTSDPETCDNADNNCNGVVDEGSFSRRLYYPDADGDTYGSASDSLLACRAPGGYVENGTDCNDECPTCYPSADEICNNDLDDNCKNGPDETPCI